MRKSIHAAEYKTLVKLMRSMREARGVSQESVAATLGITASQLSKWERRERRIDILEARKYCLAIGVDLCDLIAKWEAELSAL